MPHEEGCTGRSHWVENDTHSLGVNESEPVYF